MIFLAFFCTEVLHLQLTKHLWNVGGFCWVAARSCVVLMMYNTPTPKIVSKSVSQKIQGKWKSNETSWAAFIRWQNAIQMGFLSLHSTGDEKESSLNSKGWGRGWEQGALGRRGTEVIWCQSEMKGKSEKPILWSGTEIRWEIKGKREEIRGQK